ncbi:hypothetical protein NKI94_13865 [Mesorhizobium australicum]|uniref:hypothetical protein n=1 Tax=Mesorhizobium australicum TaxID=536018 RepID=UPI003338C8AC
MKMLGEEVKSVKKWVIFSVAFWSATSALAQDAPGTPFVKAPSVDQAKGLSGSDLDPFGVWTSNDVSSNNVAGATEKGIDVNAKPTVHALALPTNGGTLIVSQLWDESCTNYECPTQIVFVPQGGGSIQVKVPPTMLQQITPDEPNTTKGLGLGQDKPSYFLSADGKHITVKTEQHGDQTLDLESSQ